MKRRSDRDLIRQGCFQITLGRKSNQTEGSVNVKVLNWNEFDKLEELQPSRENERGCRN